MVAEGQQLSSRHGRRPMWEMNKEGVQVVGKSVKVLLGQVMQSRLPYRSTALWCSSRICLVLRLAGLPRCEPELSVDLQ